jgi:hypothetical protein
LKKEICIETMMKHLRVSWTIFEVFEGEIEGIGAEIDRNQRIAAPSTVQLGLELKQLNNTNSSKFVSKTLLVCSSEFQGWQTELRQNDDKQQLVLKLEQRSCILLVLNHQHPS